MPQRFRSLDVFRGATVALMILVNNPGSWKALYPPLAHADWHGITPTDLVFPFFLFAVGNALALVMPGLLAGGQTVFWPRVLKRTAWIFGLGLLLNASPFVRWDASGELVLRSWESLRFMGVLQRIALSFGAAAIVVWCFGRRNPAGPLWVAAALLLGYWGVTLAWGAPGDPFSLQGWFGTAVDKALLGEAHLYRGEGVPFDPEGLASTAPAVAQVLLGWWVGQHISRGMGGIGTASGTSTRNSTRNSTRAKASASASANDRNSNNANANDSRPDLTTLSQAARPALNSGAVSWLFLWASALLVIAYLWQLSFPLNKKIWSSSYVLCTTGLAMMALACCIHLIEHRRRPAELWGWVRFFEVFGRNPLFIFVLSGLVPRALALLRWQDGVTAEGLPRWTSPLPWIYNQVFAHIGNDPRLGSLLFACANLAAYAALAAWLDRRKLYFGV